MRLLPAPLLFACVLATATAQTPSPSSPQAAATSAGTAYHNDALHLTYTYPASYTDATAMVGPAFQASMSGDPASAAQAACLSLPLSRMNTSDGQMGMLLLVRADAACLKKKFNAKSVLDAAREEAHGLAASGAKVNFAQPVPYEVAANHPAALMLGSFTLPTGQTMQAMVTCVLDEPDIACWQFLATNTDRLRTMSAFPVAFGNALPTPLVPAEVLTKP